MRLISLVLGLIVLTALPLLFIFTMTWVVESGARLAIALTNNTQSQYYYYNMFNQFTQGYEWFVLVFAVLLFVFILILLLCLRCAGIER
jgi:O-antigen/teichoic acid export membrane protein